MMLIIGLGNPGREYVRTRHNIGFVAVDVISSNIRASFAKASKFKGEIATGNILDQKVILLKPDTYMNLSGEAAQLVYNYYKITLSDVIVIHDDIDLALGDIRVKCGGGHAGHKGLKSIDSCIGKDYWRIRIGIGRPNHSDDVPDYVLENFTKPESIIAEESAHSATRLVEDLIRSRVSGSSVK
ncbi:MAG: aminoacyl-tRNA hydrolase [Pseudomonadota bacterium]